VFGHSQDRVVNLAGKLSFASLAALLSKAQLYVGPDTAITHLAAATGTPTVALFGPSNPVKWGPWPKDWSSAPSPWQRKGTQFRGNVALVQGEGQCVPCLEEGCARHVESESACLQMMTVDTVISAIERLWATGAR
jgi:heptosyltransferase-3